MAMVNRLGQLDRLAGMELVLARLVALGSLAMNLTAPDWVRVRFAKSLSHSHFFCQSKCL